MPEAHERFGLLFLPPMDDGLGRILAPLADRSGLEQARRAVAYLHYLVAPYFRGPGHAANILRGPLTHLVRRFGVAVASEEIWSEMPADLRYLHAARNSRAPAAAAIRPPSSRRR